MTRLLLSTAFALCFAVSSLMAQDDMNVTSPDMTQDPEQQQQWIDGQNPYPAKPKNMWEIGVNAGHSFVAGDVDAPVWSGFGAGLTFRKSLSYVLSIRFGGQYTSSKGYDGRATTYAAIASEPTFAQNGGASGPWGQYSGGNVHRNYQTNIFSGNVELLVNIGNILFHNPEVKWNLYVAGGVGFHSVDTKVDMLTGGDQTSPYIFESVTAGLDPTTSDGRKDARKRLKDLLDGDYESEGYEDAGESDFHGLFSLGISRKLGGRVSLGLEHQIMFWGSDYMDGFTNGSSRSADMNHYTSLRFDIAIGNKEKRVAPLHWVNPLDPTMNDVAALKQRPKFDLTDSDGDGIIDMIDQEINTPAGCPVDTRGVTLDSDGDGVVDCKDKEPYSPPGYDVDADGVAQVPKYVTEQQVQAMIDARPIPDMTWFLPMVHFDLDKYYVKPEYYGALHNVASVLKSRPNMKLVVKGYADNRGTDDYNNVLSYNRAEAVVNHLVNNFAVQRDRLVLQYAGSSENIVGNLPSNYNTDVEEEKGHYMNRRVEFMVAKSGDSEMARPEGKAGSNTPGSSRSGAKYSGNRNSGY